MPVYSNLLPLAARILEDTARDGTSDRHAIPIEEQQAERSRINDAVSGHFFAYNGCVAAATSGTRHAQTRHR